jgi:hypothetical protein
VKRERKGIAENGQLLSGPPALERERPSPPAARVLARRPLGSRTLVRRRGQRGEGRGAVADKWTVTGKVASARMKPWTGNLGQ